MKSNEVNSSASNNPDNLEQKNPTPTTTTSPVPPAGVKPPPKPIKLKQLAPAVSPAGRLLPPQKPSTPPPAVSSSKSKTEEPVEKVLQDILDTNPLLSSNAPAEKLPESVNSEQKATPQKLERKGSVLDIAKNFGKSPATASDKPLPPSHRIPRGTVMGTPEELTAIRANQAKLAASDAPKKLGDNTHRVVQERLIQQLNTNSSLAGKQAAPAPIIIEHQPSSQSTLENRGVPSSTITTTSAVTQQPSDSVKSTGGNPPPPPTPPRFKLADKPRESVAITDVLQKKFVSTSSSAQTATNQPEKPSLLRTVSASALKKPAAALTPSQVTTPLTPPATISTPVASTTTEPIAAESAAAAGKLVSAAKGGVIRNAVDQGSQIPVVDTSFGASFKSSFFNLLGIKSETTQLPTTVQEQLPQVVANLNVDQLAKVVEKNEEEREKGKLEKDEETLVSAELGEKLKKRADSAEKISQQTVTKEESAEKQTEQISTITSDPVIIPTVKKKTEEQIALELFAKKTTKLLEKLKLYLPELVSLSNDISEGKFQESKPFLAYVFKQCNSFIDPELNLFWSKLRVILKRYEGISSDAAVSSAVAFYHDFDFQGKSQLLQLFQSCSFLANDTLMMGAVSGYYATNMDKETLKTLWEKANKAEATQNSKDKLFEKFIDECLNKNYFNDVAQEVLKEIFPEKFESAPTLGSP